MRISAPLACTAKVRQERAALPSMMIVQAPQIPCSQPTCVPVRPSSWRRKSESSMRTLTSRSTASPFTVSDTRALGVLRSLGKPGPYLAAHRSPLAGPRESARDRAADESGKDVPAVVGRRVHVVGRRHHFLCRLSRRLDVLFRQAASHQDRLGRLQAHAGARIRHRRQARPVPRPRSDPPTRSHRRRRSHSPRGGA